MMVIGHVMKDPERDKLICKSKKSSSTLLKVDAQMAEC